MNAPNKPDPKPTKKRSAQLVAAGASIELAKLDASDARAKETIAKNKLTREAVMAGLDAEALEFLGRLRGDKKG